jgi:F-type H+-transporting ATPase subunit delta
VTKLVEFAGSSRQSRANARSLLDETLKSSSDVIKLAKELFEFVGILDNSAALRRALTDPSRTGSEKSDLVRNLFKGKFSNDAINLAAKLAEMRWSTHKDIADVFEQLAIEAEASSANLSGQLDRLENELFQISQIIVRNSDLRQNLNSQQFPENARQELVSTLIKEKVSPITSRLFTYIVQGLRGRNIENTLSFYQNVIAARRERIIAHVKSAISLSEAQKQKIADLLTLKIGQPVRVNLEIDNAVIGGVSIRFADELIDATIVNRLAEASRALAG